MQNKIEEDQKEETIDQSAKIKETSTDQDEAKLKGEDDSQLTGYKNTVK